VEATGGWERVRSSTRSTPQQCRWSSSRRTAFGTLPARSGCSARPTASTRGSSPSTPHSSSRRCARRARRPPAPWRTSPRADASSRRCSRRCSPPRRRACTAPPRRSAPTCGCTSAGLRRAPRRSMAPPSSAAQVRAVLGECLEQPGRATGAGAPHMQHVAAGRHTRCTSACARVWHVSGPYSAREDTPAPTRKSLRRYERGCDHGAEGHEHLRHLALALQWTREHDIRAERRTPGEQVADSFWRLHVRGIVTARLQWHEARHALCRRAGTVGL
jgi:hypothetical protein